MVYFQIRQQKSCIIFSIAAFLQICAMRGANFFATFFADFANCQNDPCQNGGTCEDEIGRYTCQCLDGYTGINCQTNIDDCVNHNCQNHVHCRDGVASYECVCLEGFTGEFCETRRGMLVHEVTL